MSIREKDLNSFFEQCEDQVDEKSINLDQIIETLSESKKIQFDDFTDTMKLI